MTIGSACLVYPEGFQLVLAACCRRVEKGISRLPRAESLPAPDLAASYFGLGHRWDSWQYQATGLRPELSLRTALTIRALLQGLGLQGRATILWVGDTHKPRRRSTRFTIQQ